MAYRSCLLCSTALVSVMVFSASGVGAFVLSSGLRQPGSASYHPGLLPVAASTTAATRRGRGRGQRRMSPSEDAAYGGDNAADSSVDNTDNRDSNANNSALGDSSGDGAADVWARAELPLSNDAQVEQATGAVWKALADGKNRQILRLSLPLIGATEMDDWPGGDRQRYKACAPMVNALLLGSPAAQVREGANVVEQILDESDAVGLLQLQCKNAIDDASAMIFPTTDTLSLQQQVAISAGPRLMALVNPAWRSTADFGFFGVGEAKKALSDYVETYSLQSLVVYGYTLRMLYCYPNPWRLFLLDEATGMRELLGSWDKCPANEEVEKLVFDKKGRPNPAERVQASAKFFQDGM